MKVQTEVKQEVTVTTTTTHKAIIKFDTMVVSTNRHTQLVAEQILGGREIKFALEPSKYLDDDRAVLKLDGKMVATVNLED